MNLRTAHTMAARGLLAGLALAGLTACGALPGNAHRTDENRPIVAQTDAPQSAESAAQPVTPPPAPAPVVAPEPAAPVPTGLTAEVQQLIAARQVNELRTTYNGSYGASLLFQPETLEYYVAMFRQKDFLRVSKTKSATEAEQAYRKFAARTAEFADADIRRLKLQAEHARTERMLSERASELDALEADVSLQRQQAARIAASRKQARDEAAALAAQQKKASAELRRLQERIRVLERQQANIDAPVAPRAASKTQGAALPPK